MIIYDFILTLALLVCYYKRLFLTLFYSQAGEPKVKRETTKQPKKMKESPNKQLQKEEPQTETKQNAHNAVAVAAFVPVASRSKTPEKKTFRATATQHSLPALKTVPTQTQTSSKSLGTQCEAMQTDNVQPMIIPAPIPPIRSSKSVKTKSEGVQCDLPRPLMTNQPMTLNQPQERQNVHHDQPIEARNETPVSGIIISKGKPV